MMWLHLCPADNADKLIKRAEIHLRNMLSLTQTGAVILPPMLTYYNNPQTIEDMTRHIVGKVMAEFGLEHPKFHRWK